MAKANYNLPLDKGWEFHKGEFERINSMRLSAYHTAAQAGGAFCGLIGFFNDESWQKIEVPHDWLAHQDYDEEVDSSGGYKRRGTGWYRNKFILPQEPIESALLTFDGVLGNSVVYVNGVVAGRNFSGYNKFAFEIGDYLLPGQENVVHVYVDARKAEGWWYEGNGLYRPVYIQFREDIRLDQRGCFVRAEKTENAWETIADIAILGVKASRYVRLKATLYDETDAVIANAEYTAKPITRITIPIEKARLWSPETPTLYRLQVELIKSERVLDCVAFSVGLRTIEWRAGEGMFLNGARYQVKGICGHQDHAGMGAAVTPEVMEYRVQVMKSLGANAYRCAHHAVTDEFLSLCDKYGLLVMAENRNFAVNDDVIKQLEDMVCLSRNHPSVFLYSMFNEEPWQENFLGKRMAQKMREHVLALDRTRAVMAAQNGGMLEKENASDSFDIIGLNYNLASYDKAYERTPNKVLLGTENCPTYATRGVVKTDVEKQVFADNGREYPSNFSEDLEETMVKINASPFAAGCFVWTGMDHRGEPHPYGWPSVSSHWGFTDCCGFDKEIAYLLRAWYTDAPFVHVLSNWNHRIGEEICVHAFTNADKAELFLNGRSLGEKPVINRRAEWNVPFEEGKLSVIAKKGGVQVCDETQTAGSPARIVLGDKTPSGGDASKIVNIKIVDKDGVLVPNACPLISFKLEGGNVLGVGNGNPNSHHKDVALQVPAFNGLAQIVVTGDTRALKVSTENLNEVEIRW